MKEKYIFFTLLIIALIMLIGNRMSKNAKAGISAEELAIEKRLRKLKQQKLILPEKIDIDKIQNLVAFSHYEGMLERSPFFKAQPKSSPGAEVQAPVLPVEEMTPLFIYKGRIASGKRLVVIIEQTRSGEVFMISKGEGVDGYKVLDITDTEVILSKKGADDIVLKTIQSP